MELNAAFRGRESERSWSERRVLRRSFLPMRDVFGTFLRLGLTSFGGPIAHVAYFRHELVERQRWFSDEAYTHIVAFCSALPGPTSSQVGMICGLARAGPAGAFAAWLAFTAPSAILMVSAALALRWLEAGSD